MPTKSAVLPLSSCQKSFSLPDFCKYFLVKIAKFPGKFPVTNTSIFPFFDNFYTYDVFTSLCLVNSVVVIGLG